MSNTVVFKMLSKFIDKNPARFHTPGHKGVISAEFEKLCSFYEYDLTELEETDNLYDPKGAIRQAQLNAAKVFGAKESFFLVNGASGGVFVMLCSCFKPNDYILIDRNSHISVINAVILLGLNPIFIYPEYLTKWGISGGISPFEMENMILANPAIKGIVITSPNYYGICSDLKKLSDFAKKYNRILLVDEAHGGHFCFSDSLPMAALSCGADMCVQSLHKTLLSPTQTAILHINWDGIESERVKDALKLTHTTSPSFVFLACIEIAIMSMQDRKNELEALISSLKELHRELKSYPHLNLLDNELIGQYSICDIDITRLTVNINRTYLTGYEARDYLSKAFNVVAEMADENNIVFIFTINNSLSDLERLKEGLISLANQRGIGVSLKKEVKIIKPEMATSPRQAYFAEKEEIGISDSLGRIAAQNIMKYPINVPIVTYGELISNEIIRFLLEINIQNTIKVVK